jgi:hypothetical protein
MTKTQQPLAPKPWPRLSETLTCQRHINCCQSCGRGQLDGEVSLWQEYDENDEPEPIAVALCKQCSDRLVEPHPRIYAKVARFAPFPGAMTICLACSHRDGVRCRSPDAKANGGHGIWIVAGRANQIHVLRTPRSESGWITVYEGPPTGCSGLWDQGENWP